MLVQRNLCRSRQFQLLWRSFNSHNIRGLREATQDKRWPGWEVVVGIEVHAQIKSRKKLFSDALTSRPGDPPNTFVSQFDAAFPGTLPKLNQKCVDLAIRAALALESYVQTRSTFDRKHYFYPDLPAGYQITQRYAPLAKGGYLTLSKHGIPVRIIQIQLEQDTAKSTFDARRRESHIDLNRAGSGLMEIVSEPDLRSPEEAGDYIRSLQALLRSVGSSDGNMEQGSLRCDVNVSVNRYGEPPGTRCEIKNLNSAKFAMIAITSEVFRHIELLDSGIPVPQETRGFNEDKAETFKLRSKEDAPDYRYMPDPNIPPLLLTESYIESIRQTMPELPDAQRARLITLGLSPRDADVLMTVDAGREVGFDGEPGKGAVAYFDELAQGRDPKLVVNWMTHDLLGQLSARKETFGDNPVSVLQLGELIDMVQDGKITGTSGKTILRHMISHPSDLSPSALVQELSLGALASDDSLSLRTWCAEAIEVHPDVADAIRKGNPRVLNRLVGSVMQRSRGRADAQTVRATLEAMLTNDH
ncbi:GatB/GatE catalytic domain-containing protein [Hygrophoropsis aurantiaca]|uniref:GatB/GatE catalytic domain-containing protein n=1 Tax=Hygrophoropsis aurantiaca TaxID=72124 RepID=A0ACB8ASJ9_9AGAM|nr:GatB/GatE catalytic domain-containing protein [Hygrophoropsis aurantiaca]